MNGVRVVRITALPSGDARYVSGSQVRITDETGQEMYPIACVVDMKPGELVKATLTFFAQVDAVAVVEETE